MPQFRPRPRFDLFDDAEPVEMPLAPTTDSLPAPTLTDPRFTAMGQSPAFPPSPQTDPRFTAVKVQPEFPLPTLTDPRLATAKQSPVPAQPLQTDPRFTAVKVQPEFPLPTLTDPRLAVMNPPAHLDGSDSTSTAGRMPAQSEKLPATGQQPSFITALQATMGPQAGMNTTASRIVVIPGARTGKKTSKAVATRRLNPRLRQGVVILATLVIVVVTLTTLVPLSDSQNGNIFSNIGGLIHSAQIGWDIQAHQNPTTIPTALNGPGLPYMAIANSPYVAVAEQEATNAGIPPVYFVRQIQQESGFNPNAVSVTNAEGIAQFEPYTAAGLGINPWNPNEALRGAAHLMANYYHQYGNYAKALGAYNAGPGAVQSAVYACGMYWLGCMPAQSQNYVYRIMGV